MLLHLLYLLQWGHLNDFLNFNFLLFANFLIKKLGKTYCLVCKLFDVGTKMQIFFIVTNFNCKY
jgi:hypothetical protein